MHSFFVACYFEKSLLTSYSLNSISNSFSLNFALKCCFFKQIRYKYEIVKDTIVIFYTELETFATDTVNCYLGALLFKKCSFYQYIRIICLFGGKLSNIRKIIAIPQIFQKFIIVSLISKTHFMIQIILC